jgi:hypothetical protein
MHDKAKHAFASSGGSRDVEMGSASSGDGYRPTAMETDGQYSHLPELQRRVIMVIKELRAGGNYQDGVNVGAIARNLASYGNETQIRYDMFP